MGVDIIAFFEEFFLVHFLTDLKNRSAIDGYAWIFLGIYPIIGKSSIVLV